MPGRVPEASFIPKQGVSQQTRKTTSRRVYVLGYVSTIIFLTAVLATLGTVFYKVTLDTQLEETITRFTAEEANFDQGVIARAKSLEQRLLASQKVLDDHNAVSDIFGALESTITDSVTYTEFSFSRSGEGQAGGPTITFAGAAESFDAILFQAEEFQAHTLLNSAEVGTITYGLEAAGEAEGVVAPAGALITFAITEPLEPGELVYTATVVAESFGGEPATTTESIVTTATSTATSSLEAS